MHFAGSRSVITPTLTAATAPSERFKELNEAYRVLSDRQRRTAYDMFGHAGGGCVDRGRRLRGVRRRLRPVRRHLRRVLRRPAGRRDPRRNRVVAGADLRYDLRIEFAEAIAGVTREISFPTLVRCTVCEGSGGEPGTSRRSARNATAPARSGASAQTILGQMVNIIACPRCNGEGRIISQPATAAHGDGRVREERTIEVDVPAGIDSGQRIAMEGQGEAGPRGGPPGDLYVAVSVADHPSSCVGGRSSSTSCRSRSRRPRWAPRSRFPRPMATRSCPFPPERRAGRR